MLFLDKEPYAGQSRGAVSSLNCAVQLCAGLVPSLMACSEAPIADSFSSRP